MPATNLVFTQDGDKVVVTGTFPSGIVDLTMDPANYMLMRMSAGTLWLRPLNGAYDIGAFPHSSVLTPATAGIDALEIALRTLFSTPSTMSISPKNAIYVSALHGSPTGNGSIADPLDTIADGMVLANTNAIDDGNIPWTVVVLSGDYDEQISAISSQVCYLVLSGGVNVSYSGLGATLNDLRGPVNVTMMNGSTLSNIGGGAVVSGANNTTTITGCGTIDTLSVYPSVECAVGGTVNIAGCRITNLASATQTIVQTGGTVRLNGVTIEHIDTSAAVQMDGGAMNLQNTIIYCPNTLVGSVDSASPQTVQMISCAASYTVGGFTIVGVGPFTVNAGLAV